MKPALMTSLFFVVLFLALISIALQLDTRARVAAESKKIETVVRDLQDSLRSMRAGLDTLQWRMPGLGEYMTSIQLHVAKLWFAARAENWELTSYELNELTEAAEGAEQLHAIKNGVNITGVIDAMLQTQVAKLKKLVDRHNPAKLRSAYEETLQACNACHKSSGYGYIHVVTPTAPPVTNQEWKVVK